MRYPTLIDNQQKTEMAVSFTGYDHRPSCIEGSYFDMQNMSGDYLPAMASRKKRGIEHTFTKFQGMINKDGLVWIDNGELYIDGIKKTGFSLTNSGMKDISKMGAYLTFLPDKKWYNTANNTYGEMQAYYDNTHKTGTVIDSYSAIGAKMSQADGTVIDFIDENQVVRRSDYNDGTPDGTNVLTWDWDSTNQIFINEKLCKWKWASQTFREFQSMYVKISGFRINGGYYGSTFPIKEGDGVKITAEWYDSGTSPSTMDLDYDIVSKLFTTKESDTKWSGVFTIEKLIERTVSSNKYYDLVVRFDRVFNYKPPAREGHTAYDPVDITNYKISLERLVPDIKFTIECNNRLWGCSNDGHEIYATKLGSVENWNYFAGTSMDSWAVNLGSDGVFTGVAVLQGNPVFFKENYIIKIGVSSIGAHSMREINAIGVEEGSEDSLVRINEVLYYKAIDGIYAYDGSYPIRISDKFGDVRYHDAVGGNLSNMYYVSMKDDSNKSHVFVYDIQHGLWFKEDNAEVKQYCKYKEDLYFVESNKLYIRDGAKSDAKEKEVDWFVVSGDIGYLYTSKKHANRIDKKSYINKLQINAQLPVGSYMSVYINYDSSDEWEFLWDLSGAGTRLFNIPVRPRRCDHFRYKIVGHGDAKIFSITKTYVDGSEL